MTVTSPADVRGFVAATIARHGRDPANLLQILVAIQDAYRHIPREAARILTSELGLPWSRIEGVIGFYSFLSDRPLGDYVILFSDNIVDQMLGKQPLMDRLCRRLGVTPGVPRPDGRVTVDNTSCTGMPDQGPAALVNGHAVTRLTAERIDRIARLVDARTPLEAWPPEYFRVEDNVRRRDLILAGDFTPGEALRILAEHDEETLFQELEVSGLRGRGGAGFDTVTKWRACRQAPGDAHYVVCNADEGEPGTFKDRVLLQSYADLVFEGMTVAGRLIDARQGYLYLRGEYRYLLDGLQGTLERRRKAGLLGGNILGRSGWYFDIQIHLGAGAYVCGEETALLESQEGKRGLPRRRPPFPVTQGYRDRPTVVNNVETFAAAARVAVHGGAWFAGAGTSTSRGTRFLSISGDCERPGVYEYPFGVALRQILADCGAPGAIAVQVAGAAGQCVPAREFDRTIDFGDLPTGGSFMVFGAGRDMLDMVRNFAHFFVHESCGFCTPCRVGTSLLRNLVEKVYQGHGTPLDLQEIRQLGEVMRNTSQCGLGQTAPSAALSTLDKFPEVYERRLKHTAFEPAFDLDAAVSEARRITHRDDAAAHIPEES